MAHAVAVGVAHVLIRNHGAIQSRIWTAPVVQNLYLRDASCRAPNAGTDETGQGDCHEGLWSILPGRQGRRGLLRALDAVAVAGTAVRQHAVQRSASRRTADVAKLAQSALEAARGDRRGRAQAGSARAAIPPDAGRPRVRAH